MLFMRLIVLLQICKPPTHSFLAVTSLSLSLCKLMKNSLFILRHAHELDPYETYQASGVVELGTPIYFLGCLVDLRVLGADFVHKTTQYTVQLRPMIYIG